jgi:hypothetical protein
MVATDDLVEDLKRFEAASRRWAPMAGVALLLITGAIAYASWSLTRKQREIAVADVALREKQELLVEKQAQLLSLEKKIADLKANVAGLTRLASASLQSQTAGKPPITAESHVTAVISSAGTDATQPPPPRVYIYIPQKAIRTRANEIAVQLQNNGYVVPFIELVGDDPRTNTLKFFVTDEIAKTESQELAQILTAAGLPVRILPMAVEPTTTDLRPRHFELWFSSASAQSGAAAVP